MRLKARMSKLADMSAGKWYLLVYSLVLGGWLLFTAAGFAADAVIYICGGFSPYACTLDDFDMLSLERADSMTCITLGEDSQMLLKDVPPHVRTLDTDVQFSTEIGEYILFYTTEEGQAFSAERAVYGVPYPGGWHFELPRGHIEQLRLDTGVIPAVTCSFSRIEWNALSSIWQLWQMDTCALFWCAVLPGFAVSAVLIFRKAKRQK